MRALLLTLVLAGCSSKSEPPAAEVAVEKAPAPPAVKSRKDALAHQILAAIAADDFDQLRPLFQVDGVPATETGPLADLNADHVRELRGKLAELKIDLANAKYLRVEVTGEGTGMEMFDVFVEANGRVYRTHFSAMVTRGGYKLLGIANWIVPENGMSKN